MSDDEVSVLLSAYKKVDAVLDLLRRSVHNKNQRLVVKYKRDLDNALSAFDDALLKCVQTGNVDAETKKNCEKLQTAAHAELYNADDFLSQKEDEESEKAAVLVKKSQYQELIDEINLFKSSLEDSPRTLVEKNTPLQPKGFLSAIRCEREQVLDRIHERRRKLFATYTFDQHEQDTLNESFNEIKRAFNGWNVECLAETAVQETPKGPSPRPKAADVKIDRLNLPVFDGNARGYARFVNDFNSTVGLAHDDPKVKLLYLKGQCLRGLPKEMVKNVTEFDVAISRLQDHYGQASLVITEVLRELELFKVSTEPNHEAKTVIKLHSLLEGMWDDLSAVGATHDFSNIVTLKTIESKLPDRIQYKWVERKLNLKEKPVSELVEQLILLLGSERKIADGVLLAKGKVSTSKFDLKPKKFTGNVFAKVKDGQSDSKQTGQCYRCGKPGHVTKSCRLPRDVVCSYCNGKSHIERACLKKRSSNLEQPHDTTTKPDTHPKSKHTVTFDANSEKGEIATVTGPINTCKNENEVAVRLPLDIVNSAIGPCNVLYDSGSQMNLIDESFASKKGLKGKRATISYRVINGEVRTAHTTLYQIVLLSKTGVRKHIHAYSMPVLMDELQIPDIVSLAKSFPRINAVKSDIALPKGKVELLIGSQHIVDFPKVVWSSGSVALLQNKFSLYAYSLAGAHCSFTSVSNEICHVASVRSGVLSDEVICDALYITDFRKQRSLKDFWSLEGLGTFMPAVCNNCKNCKICKADTQILSYKEACELVQVKEGLIYDLETKTWTASYPMTVNPIRLRDNYADALKALESRERRLLKDANLASQYSDQISDFVTRNVLRKLSQKELDEWDGPIRYVDHHEVYKEGSTTPLRVVVNSSFKKGSEMSLNDILVKGPNVLNDLFSVLIRWRLFPVAFSGDIRKMYHTIRTGELEGHLRRLLWRDFEIDRDPDVYVFVTVTFGDKPAGCIAVTALRETAEMFSELAPNAAEIIKRDTYMDDVISGAADIETAKSLISSIREIAEKGGFAFKDFVISGDSASNQELPESSCTDRVLGVEWSPPKDVIAIKLNLNPNRKFKGKRKIPEGSISDIALTKRVCLRLVNSCYDPYGLLSPLSIKLKLYMRESFVDSKLKWDDPLPDDLDRRFKILLEELSSLQCMEIPRAVLTDCTNVPTLICFCDASQLGMCAAVYVRSCNEHGEVQSRLLTAKTRVAPSQSQSIPRLELSAAVIGSRLVSKILATKAKFDVCFLTDSKVVIGMISNTKSLLKDYVGSRVAEIRSLTNLKDWGWLRSENNIADLGTRGGTPKDTQSVEWLEGPGFVKEPLENWPVEFISTETDDATQDLFLTVLPETFAIDAKNFSDVQRLVRTTAFCFRYVHILRSKPSQSGTITVSRNFDYSRIQLTADEVEKAEQHWINLASTSLIYDVEAGKLSSLRPEIVKDDDGNVVKIVTSGRLGKLLKIGYDVNQLILLDGNHPFTYLILKKIHEERHGGDNYVLFRSRSRFWIPNARKFIRKIRKKCFFCKLLTKKSMTQIMAPIPDERVLPCPPWTNVGIDLFGPLEASDMVKKRLKSKCWGLIISCLATRAVHLDLTQSYDTDSLLQALRRFIGLRGSPSKILSDQGTQMIAASKEVAGMIELLDFSSIKGWCATRKIQWEFTPVRGQHVNGCTESLIKSTKKILSIHLHGKNLSFVELQTVLVEVAQILNSRPLGISHKPGTDPLDGGPITPNHLLFGRATNAVPTFPYDQNVRLTKRIRFMNTVLEEFWHKFRVQVFHTLLPSYKWKKEGRIAKLGDVVLMEDCDLKVGEYRLGKIVGVKLGSDGKARTLTLEYVHLNAQGNVTRSRTVRSTHKCSLIVPIEEQS